jgi:hypothetical protein
MESQEAGFPPFPHSLEIPSGLPHSHGLGCWHISKYKSMRDRSQGLLDLKGVVTEVLGPKCNERSSTLTPSKAWFPYARASARMNVQGGRCGKERPAEILSRLSRLFFLFRGVQRGYFSFQRERSETMKADELLISAVRLHCRCRLCVKMTH